MKVQKELDETKVVLVGPFVFRGEKVHMLTSENSTRLSNLFLSEEKSWTIS